jgi:fatty-acyl-CoA synthase
VWHYAQGEAMTEFREHPRRWAVSEPNRPAIIMAGSSQVVTYGELDRRSNQAAHLFRKLGLKRGDHVAIIIENHPRFLEITWAAQNAGLYYTPISWRFRPDEIAFILRDCGTNVVLYTQQQAELMQALSKELPSMTYIAVDCTAPGHLDYEREIAAMPSTPIADESRGSDMVYSSGSTGRPKGIKQALPDLGVDGLSPMFRIYTERYGWGEDTVYLMSCPIYHSGPLRFSMAMQQVGATLLLMEKFDARESLRLCQRYRVTHAHWVPTMLVRIMKLPESERNAFDLSSVRMVIHGAAPCAPEVKEAMIEWLGPILEESYGGTEGNGLTMISSKEWLAHRGSVGRPFLGSIHILDDDGNELPPRQVGTVYFSGGPRFSYHNNPEKTAAAYDDKGRSTLGDMGYLDEDGYLYLTERKDHMVISGGVNVFPQEAENVLVSHPKVADAAVFGVPNEDMGQVLHAVVQPVEIAEAGPELERELIEHCRQNLASIKCPRTLSFKATLPRHDTGKIYIRLLKTEYMKEHGLT